ncbi:MAG: hypothetical protein B7X93_02280 [Hydrogenophilales bacterium 17-61-9]|nr:MAG: hypothetical protein B7X93_02280 [Hydrogenophilales bacterium 17-61-9]
MRRTALLGLALLHAPLAHAASQTWDGWIIGEPCAAAFQVADCPLRHVDHPVLLLEDGRTLAFLYGEGRSIAPDALDKAYGKKVRLIGEFKDGVLQPVKLDLLETSGERKFFKGCL